jgi:predicted AlkP superfamily pyrophosphatase or phosphodiesterase
VISWDGASAQRIYDLMARGELPHFSDLARRGLRAEYALAPNPTLTFTAHSSLATGALPARTGLVSNAFHDARILSTGTVRPPMNPSTRPSRCG